MPPPPYPGDALKGWIGVDNGVVIWLDRRDQNAIGRGFQSSGAEAIGFTLSRNCSSVSALARFPSKVSRAKDISRHFFQQEHGVLIKVSESPRNEGPGPTSSPSFEQGHQAADFNPHCVNAS